MYRSTGLTSSLNRRARWASPPTAERLWAFSCFYFLAENKLLLRIQFVDNVAIVELQNSRDGLFLATWPRLFSTSRTAARHPLSAERTASYPLLKSEGQKIQRNCLSTLVLLEVMVRACSLPLSMAQA